jgi:hypothetical protein
MEEFAAKRVTVTIAVEDGPTVRLSYDGTWVNQTFPHFSSVEIHHQVVRPTLPCHWLRDVIGRTATLLLWYSAHEEDWPAELRAAGQHRHTEPTPPRAAAPQEPGAKGDRGWDF